MNLILTFSRRYGTGTSIIVEELSKKLNMPVYGKDYICKQVQSKESLKSEEEIIKKLAEKSCIIVGRGASEVLKDNPNVLNIYVYAEKEDRIKRIMDKHNISEENAKQMISKIDKERIDYFEKNTGKFWGEFDNYDIIIDSSKYGIDSCANIILKYLEANQYI